MGSMAESSSRELVLDEMGDRWRMLGGRIDSIDW